MLERALTMLLAGCLCAAAPYQAPARLVLQSSSDCPSGDEVSAVLAPLLPDTIVSTAPAPSGDAERAIINDAGDDFSVHVAGQERTFHDAGRSCSERARLAAVFIGLVLAPPLEPAQQPEPEPAPPAPISAPPDSPPAEPPRANAVELALMLQAAPGAETTEPALAGGLGARFVHGRMPGLSLGAAAFLPTTLRFELADARVVRVPVDLSLRLQSARSTLEAWFELGAFVGLLVASGERVQNQQTELRPELGARAALAASLELSSKLCSFLSIQASFVPKPHEFEVRPSERAGVMPNFWVGGALGVALRP